MQISERRMQNEDFVFGFRLTCKQNHLRFSQVVFPFFARPKGCALTSYSAFCILTYAFAKSQIIARKGASTSMLFYNFFRASQSGRDFWIYNARVI